MDNKESSAVYRANRKYEKQNYYSVNVRFPIAWKETIKENAKDGRIQKYIIDCVGKEIGLKYTPIDLIEKKKTEKQKKEGNKTE